MTVLTKIAIAAGIIVVLLLVTALAVTWTNPLAVFAWTSRAKLGRAGLERRSLAVRGGALTYWEGGHGATVILLHGAGDQAGSWATVAGALVQTHHLVIPDLPGHGSSDPKDGPLSLGTVRDGVDALVAAQGDPPILVGNSLGAWVACLVAAAHPERVSSLVLVNGGPSRGEATGVNLLPQDRDEARRTVAALRDPGSPQVPGFVLDDIVRQSRKGPIGRLAQTVDEMDSFLLEGREDEVSVPVDIIWGSSDRLMPLEYARRLQQALPEATLTVLDHCGHVPQQECPKAFQAALGEALGRPRPAGADALAPSGGAHEVSP